MATRSPSTGSTWPCREAPCSACSGPTAPARRPRSGSSPRCSRPTRAGRRSPASTSLRDPARSAGAIGLSGQYAAVDEYLTGYENLDMVGRLYHLGRAPVRGPRPRAARAVRPRPTPATGRSKTYSGGMRRRLDLAGALVADPPVLFLDEPTTGLDPRSRNDMWDVIAELVARRHHAAADHAVPRGGRPAGRPHRRDRPRPGRSPRAPPTSSRPRSAASGSSSWSPMPRGLDRGRASLLAEVGDGAGRASTRTPGAGRRRSTGGAAALIEVAAPARRGRRSPSHDVGAAPADARRRLPHPDRARRADGGRPRSAVAADDRREPQRERPRERPVSDASRSSPSAT